jgi:hypothetical protein
MSGIISKNLGESKRGGYTMYNHFIAFSFLDVFNFLAIAMRHIPLFIYIKLFKGDKLDAFLEWVELKVSA